MRIRFGNKLHLAEWLKEMLDSQVKSDSGPSTEEESSRGKVSDRIPKSERNGEIDQIQSNREN